MQTIRGAGESGKMWTTAVSIDKQYGKEFDYILREIAKCKYATYAVEESKNRFFINIAGEDENGALITHSIVKIITDVILIYFKARYIKNRLAGCLDSEEVSDAMAILISALIYFDAGIESGILYGIIEESGEYSIDGIFTFRTEDLADNWEELCALSVSLLSMNPDETDILNLTAFLIDASGGKKNKIAVVRTDADVSVLNVTLKEKIYIHDIFADKKQNLANAVISGYPESVYTEEKAAGEITDNLKHIVRVERLSGSKLTGFAGQIK
ncbi:MAG: hypothetical protein LBT30_01775 [Clostridiales bacterium]|jgi:hypothetical protein|nr:hypothetical protein [Clostridiales bacterium]